MKIKFNKLCGMLLAVLMILSLAACSGGSGTSSSSGATDQSDSGAPVADSKEEGKKIVIGISNCSETDLYCKMVTDRLKAMLEKGHPEWEIMLTAANMDPNIQLEQVQSFIARKVDLIVITAADAKGSVSSIDAANDAGIPIISFVNPVDSPVEDRIFVGASNVLCGEGIANILKDKLPENAKVCIMEGTPGHINGSDRVKGFTEVLSAERPDVEIIASMTGYYEREKALKVTEDWIQAYPQIDAIMCANDEMGLGVVEALRAANRLESTMVASVDGIEEALYSVQAGDMYSTMFQNFVTQTQYCYDTVEAILIDGNTKPEDIAIEFDGVTKENVDEYIETFIKNTPEI